MRKLLLAALAAFCVSMPAWAQPILDPITSSGASGTLAATGDVVRLPALGIQWTNVRFSVLSAGTATATAQISIDGGTNWIASPYGKRISTVSANPTVQAISSTTLVTGDTWEIPLPATATHFRLLCGAGGTTTSVSIVGGLFYLPGVPVVAVLYDVTSATNVALDTGTLDVSGWLGVQHDFVMSGGTPAFSMQEVDDAGVSLANIVTGTAAFMGCLGYYGIIGGTSGIVVSSSFLTLPKRMRYQSAAIAAQTSRIRLVAYR
jgi:hypothetical protein